MAFACCSGEGPGTGSIRSRTKYHRPDPTAGVETRRFGRVALERRLPAVITRIQLVTLAVAGAGLLAVGASYFLVYGHALAG